MARLHHSGTGCAFAITKRNGIATRQFKSIIRVGMLLEIEMIMTTAHPLADGQWAHLPADPSLNARQLELEAGSVLFEPSTPARTLYFIDSGQVRTYEAGPDESARLLEILGPGEWFGEAALAQADSHSSRAVAVSPSVVWEVPVERLMELMSREPSVSAELIRQLASRLQSSREDANRLVFDDCSARLVKTLLRFSRTAASTMQEDGTVMLQITHRQLAQAVGAARETVSLALTQLRQQNLLRTGRNRLLFNPDALESFSHADPADFEAGIVHEIVAGK